MSAARSLRIVVVAPLRFPVRWPHAGGLETAVWSEVDALRRRGHEVTLIAPEGSDFLDSGSPFSLPALDWPADAVRSDQTYPPSYEQVSVPALARALDAVAAQRGRFDVISNHCLHPLPLRRAPELGVPMVTTLHTPVDAGFVSAHRSADGLGSVFLSVSDHTRREWARAGVPSTLLPNGVDADRWPAGPGGDGLVWFGRLVPEKGPHLAIEVARRIGRPLTLAGRVGDREYFAQMLRPALDADITWTGPLAPAELATLVGSSAVALATPVWAEPFGLVAPEALLCGTPVVSFQVGGVPEIAARAVGMRLAHPGDTVAMADAAASLIADSDRDAGFRDRIRDAALREFSLDARVRALEALYESLSPRAGAALDVEGELVA